MHLAILPERGVVKVMGEDARRFLNGLLTTDLGTVAPGRPRFAALLTPQGKILVDCVVGEWPAESGAGLFLDCPRVLAPMLAERLNFYKLRAPVTISDVSATLSVLALWNAGADGLPSAPPLYPDPRLAALGQRLIVPNDKIAEAARTLGVALVDATHYEAHRIALGVPQGGVDFIYGDAFPHETNMDQLGGVDFDKGCYVGQEVVSRIEHRASARNRIVPIAYEGSALDPGIAVIAGDKIVGNLSSAVAGHGLAMLRLDRVSDALKAGLTLKAGEVTIRLVKPSWVQFAFPGE